MSTAGTTGTAAPDRGQSTAAPASQRHPGPEATPCGKTAACEAWEGMRALVVGDEAFGEVRRISAEVGLTAALMKALVKLSPEHPVAMRELADQFGCDASYVTALVDGLEKAGMAERQAHPTDRRIKVVVPTTKGKATVARVEGLLSKPPSSFGRLSPAEQDQLRDLVSKLNDPAPDHLGT
ncbi:MAG TPA: MarR family winged helix-turn-helix transcriptional regulator [Acidimicrobiales bacterium]|nr:MarR family winged helix-turn-helix transcriptional regulator [Acidimicrobiales bacterium]